MTADNRIYHFKISLKDTSPVIWRRILIPSDGTLADLHYVIQIVMGWTNFHLNRFQIREKRYTIANSSGMWSPSAGDGSDVKLSALGLKLNQRFLYEYDFTSSWEFELRLARILSVDDKKTYPACLSGFGASPEEDCGGARNFTMIKDERFDKSINLMLEFGKALLDDDKADILMTELFDRRELQEAAYWIKIDEYECEKANKYLKLYAEKDNRWREAFDEVTTP